ncbi:MAG TPA: hypothetical protein VGI17_03590 [Solirubrobacterales bacterium]|jgi:hypothetical protein
MTTNSLSSLSLDEISEQRHSSNEEFNAAVGNLFEGYADNAGLLDAEARIDLDVLDQRIYDEIKTKHVKQIQPPDGDDDRRDPEKSSTKDELMAAIFTAGPSIADAEANDVMSAVYAKCQSTVWNRTQSGKRGAIQKRFEGDKLVLIHGKVFRHGNPIKDGIYVSTHEEVMLRDYWGPRLAKLQKLSDSFQEDFAMMKERVPASVEASVRAALGEAFVEATAKLPVPTLSPGDPSVRKALEK